MKAFREKIKNFLISFGLYYLPASTKIELKNVIAMMHPVKSGFDLVRIGGNNDGGYLLPNDLDGIAACFSPGVDNTASFEEDFIKITNAPCFLADFSVDQSPISSPHISFQKKFLGTENTDKFIRLETWVEENSQSESAEYLLQMDIEGAEFEVILDTPNIILNKFRIIVLELHNMDRMFGSKHLNLVERTMRKLGENFDVVHLHPNNGRRFFSRGEIGIPKVIEMTLLRKDRVREREYISVLPHPLDQPNVVHNPDYPMPNCWIHERA